MKRTESLPLRLWSKSMITIQKPGKKEKKHVYLFLRLRLASFPYLSNLVTVAAEKRRKNGATVA